MGGDPPAGGPRRDRPAVGVVGRGVRPLRQVGGEELLPLGGREHGISGERQVPAVEVAGRGQDAAVAAQVPVGSVGGPWMVERRPPGAVQAVAVREPPPVPGRQAEAGAGHAGRQEELVAHQLAERAPGGGLGHRGEQAVAGVRVAEPSPRRHHQPRREEPPQHLVAGHRLVLGPQHVGQAGGVAEELVQGDRGLVGRRGREEAGDGVLHPQPSLLLQLEDGGGGELLRHRGDVEERVGRERLAARLVGEAVALVDEDRAAPRDEHGAGESERFQAAQIAVERRAVGGAGLPRLLLRREPRAGAGRGMPLGEQQRAHQRGEERRPGEASERPWRHGVAIVAWLEAVYAIPAMPGKPRARARSCR